jgi:hypothetical protein
MGIRKEVRATAVNASLKIYQFLPLLHWSSFANACVIFVLIAVLPPNVACAATKQSVNYGGDVYCGIYCVYAAASIFGRETDLLSFASNDFVDGANGSTINQLRDALSVADLYGVSVSNLPVSTLKHMRQPVILHVRKDLFESKHADHFVLYLGEWSGKAWILDPPNLLSLVPFSILSARWDNAALVVGDKPSSHPSAIGTLDINFALRRVLWMTVLLVVLGGLNQLIRISKNIVNVWVKQAILLMILTMAFSLFDFGADFGLLRETDGVELIQSVYFPKDYRKYSRAEFDSILKSGKVVVVDARYAADYRLNHIPGAVNIPPNIRSL